MATLLGLGALDDVAVVDLLAGPFGDPPVADTLTGALLDLVEADLCDDVAKRHKQHRHYGWQVVVHLAPDYLGLINLNGSVVAPRPNRDWREKPNAGGERRR